MIVKNLKAVVMFSVLAALAGSVIVFEHGHADSQAGQTIVREMRTGELGADHVNMNRLQKIMTSETATDAEKQSALTQMQQIKERTANTIPSLAPEKQSEIRSNIDLLGDKIWELKTRGTDIPIVSIGTDYENGYIQIGILHTELDEQKIQAYEDMIRQILGSEIDMTIEPKGQIFFDTCSQTGNCEPIKAGVKIMVQDSAGDCSMGFKASYNGRTGFVTAGHCNSADVGGTGERVGNPTSSASDGLGTVHANAFGTTTWCDCLFVDATESVSDKIYQNIDASGTLFPTTNDWVSMEGKSTKGVTGQIVDNYEHFYAQFPGDNTQYYIKGAVKTDYGGLGGDSGGPVYEAGASVPKFGGTHSASDSETDTAYYIPYYRHQNAFPGLTWQFS